MYKGLVLKLYFDFIADMYIRLSYALLIITLLTIDIIYLKGLVTHIAIHTDVMNVLCYGPCKLNIGPSFLLLQRTLLYILHASAAPLHIVYHEYV